MRIGRTLLKAGMLAALLAAQPMAALAQSEPEGHDIAAGPTFGTLGFGADVSFKLQNNFVLRINGNYFASSNDEVYDGIAYNFDIELASVGAVVDFHPFGNGFLISGGVYWNGNGADLTSTPVSNVVIGNVTYTPAQVGTLRGTLEFNEVAPYFGIGYDGAFTSDGPVSFNIRLGLYYMGNAKVRYTTNGLLAGNPAFEADLAREAANVENDLDALGLYPALSIGLKIRF